LDKTATILIIVIIILVGALGLAGGFILQGYLIENSNTNNTTDNQNSTENSTNNTTVQNNDESNNQQSSGISEAQAVHIAEQAIGPINQDYYIQTTFSTGSPYKWRVEFFDSETNQLICAVSINAITGEVRNVYYP